MRDSLRRAEDHLLNALELLDSISAPSDIGAYVDMAIHRLKNFEELLDGNSDAESGDDGLSNETDPE